MTITNTRRFYRGEIWTTIAYAFPHERDEFVCLVKAELRGKHRQMLLPGSVLF